MYNKFNEEDKIKFEVMYSKTGKSQLREHKAAIRNLATSLKDPDGIGQLSKDSMEYSMLSHKYLQPDAIRLISLAAQLGDKECSELLQYIPSLREFEGLFPETMKSFDIKPDTK